MNIIIFLPKHVFIFAIVDGSNGRLYASLRRKVIPNVYACVKLIATTVKFGNIISDERFISTNYSESKNKYSGPRAPVRPTTQRRQKTRISPEEILSQNWEERELSNQREAERARALREPIPKDYSNSCYILRRRHIRVQTTTEFRIFFNPRGHTLDRGQFAGYLGARFSGHDAIMRKTC